MSKIARFGPVTKLAGAAAFSQLIPMLAAPLLTRWYSAAEIGQWALFAALAANLATVACARYEYAIVLPRSTAEAGLVLQLSLVVCAGMAALLTAVVIAVLILVEDLGPIQGLGRQLMWLPLAFLLAGLTQALNLWNNRHKAFGVIAQARVVQQGVATVVQLAANAGGMVALIIGQLLGAIAAPLWLWWRGTAVPAQRMGRSSSLRRLARRYRQFPLINSPHAFINAMQETLVIALIAAVSGPAAAGYYAIMVRLVKAPASLVGGALSEVLLGELAQGWRVGKDLRPLLLRQIRRLALWALPPSVLLFAFAPLLFEHALGEPWRVAGEYARWLTPYVWAHFVVAPMTVAPMVTGRQGMALVLSVVGNLIYVVAVAVSLSVTGDLRYALAAISLSMPLFFAAYLWWLLRGSGPRPGAGAIA
ncbi:oligosaccharide flippase family protein [Paucibacter sp. B2R-40]|uniref:lipopolysaccharide biosynthesis protein n=1 Tax=Paucibacter sp. B2R-40 TaxID=2893554 RepID=UPI0021E422CE|nr:oligosaccharide flippase family protein [Paucibacter sp. B2R-40]MCV2354543.1 oligosaccharide flippase family protein [Paucibacter sp. B2R-40]